MREKVYLEKFSIWNCSIIVHVIDTKSKSELGFLVSLNTELGDSLYEFCGVEMLKSIVKSKHECMGVPLKSTSPFPSWSNMSITRWTRGFCWSSGRDMNSSMLREPELSKSSFRKRFPNLLISSASTAMWNHQMNDLLCYKFKTLKYLQFEHSSIGRELSLP